MNYSNIIRSRRKELEILSLPSFNIFFVFSFLHFEYEMPTHGVFLNLSFQQMFIGALLTIAKNWK